MKRRHCGICGRVGHDRRAHDNPQFFTEHGVIHPMRKFYVNKAGYKSPSAQKAYDQHHVDYNARERAATGQSAADQQLGRQFDKWVEKQGREEKRAEHLYKLKTEREGLKDYLDNDPAADLTPLISDRGKARSESGLIPFELARKYLPKSPESYRTAKVKRGAHTYLRREYVLDELAENRGYRNAEDMDDAIRGAIKTKKQLAEMDSEIKHLESQAKRASKPKKKRNPSPITGFLRKAFGI